MASNDILAMLGTGDLVGPKGNTVPISSLAGKSLALYFSAHWCPPCRMFTPALVKVYEAMRAGGRDDFEFIFLSSDRSEAQFDEYRATMPWLSLPYAKRDEKTALSTQFRVTGIPSLITVAPDGTVVNAGARGAAMEDPTGAAFPWPPQPLSNLEMTTECNGLTINDAPALVAFLEGCDDIEQREAIDGALRPAAEAAAVLSKGGGGGGVQLWFYAAGSGGVVQRVRTMCGLGAASADAGAQMIILDLPDRGAYYVSDASEVTPETLAAFVGAFNDGKRGLTRKQLS
eukprot:TRINITY_DN9985_c0_g1_i1.p1 TRINITY_DN9985_c0_g1~~TRINITY_DN9985_c0_g1_i1.p1  ORF type:complete len:305 (+),score=77.27 TRINITY_DN9985_c0_g1_i1:57-917(+)